MEQPNILIVDDDDDIRSLLADFLEQNGFKTYQAINGKQMFAVLETKNIQLVILDLNLPEVDGIDLCKQIRLKSTLPIIMVTAKTSPIDRVVGLETGADDYVCKPFEPLELVSRVRSVLRRSQHHSDKTQALFDADQLTFAGWTFDLKARHLMSPQNTVISLSGAEYKLLVSFVEKPNKVLTRDFLMDVLHGRDAGPFDRSIDLQISRLRQKIETDPKIPQLIKTVRNAGYIFTPNVKSIHHE